MLKHAYITLTFLLWIGAAWSQTGTTSTFADTVKKYFDYRKISETPCKNVPTAIYAVTFTVDKNHAAQNFTFSNDTLIALRHLLTTAIQLSAMKARLSETKIPYLQLFYLNTVLLCDNTADSTPLSDNIYSDVSRLLGAQLNGIKNSFENLLNKPEAFMVLPAIMIDNNFNNHSPHKGFVNDTRASKMTDQQKAELEKLIQDRKHN